MLLSIVLLLAAAVVGLAVLVAVVTLRRDRLIGPAALPGRLRELAPFFLFLGLILSMNKGLQQLSRDMSFMLNWNITSRIYDIEGPIVANVQNTIPDGAAIFFIGVYVVGYVLLLVFPIVAYALYRNGRFCKELLLAYAVNYGVGLLFYTMFIAYGPRNVMPDLVNQPMFDDLPQLMLVTSFANSNTNVFPSLHTSLSTTVVLLAWRTRAHYPAWTWIATIIGACVVLSTMVLGIHWLTDVIVGVGLGILAVIVATDVTDRLEGDLGTRVRQYGPRPFSRIGRDR